MFDYKNAEKILEAEDVVVKFNLRGKTLTAIRGISMELYKGESLAIVGESGSGKSVFTKTFMGLLDQNGWVDSGSIIYSGGKYAGKGVDLVPMKTEKEWLNIRGKEIAMVFQDPMTSLNPLKTIGKQIQETVELHQNLKGEEAKKKTIEILEDVGIAEPERRYKQYPHEFSGGMRQRVVIAIAVACNPEILITHDLGVVANVADRIAVMYAGDIVEVGLCEEIFYNAKHPYSWALLSSLPQLGVKGEPLYSIKGTPPNLFNEIKGDAFAPRNPQALKIDFEIRPPYFEVSPTHRARTWLLDPRAPKVEPPALIARMFEKWKEAAPDVQ